MEFIMAAPEWKLFSLFPSIYSVQHPYILSSLPAVLSSPDVLPSCSPPFFLSFWFCFSLLCSSPFLEVCQETLNCVMDWEAGDKSVQTLIKSPKNNAMCKMGGKHSVMGGCSFVALNSFISHLFQFLIQLVREFSVKCTDRIRGSQMP